MGTMEFIASYDPETQAGSVYNQELEHEIVFLLVNGNEWHPLTSFNHGQEKPIPSCFSPAQEILSALTLARVQGHPHTFGLD